MSQTPEVQEDDAPVDVAADSRRVPLQPHRSRDRSARSHRSIRRRSPVKGSVGRRLLSPIDRRSIVHGGGAKQIASLGIHRVGRSTGIDQKRPPFNRHDDSERIRVGVSSVEEAMAAHIEIT